MTTGLLLIAITLFCLQAAVALNTTTSAASGSSNQISPSPAGDNYTKGNLLYSDDFSSSKSGWYTSSSGDFQSAYKQGKYHIIVIPDNYWWQIYGPSKANFTDFAMDVETTKEAGPDDNVFGVIIREVAYGNYYAFLLSNDGYFEVVRKFNGTWDSAEWSKDTANAIKPGDATNLITVTAKGGRFGFYANGVKLADYNDSTFSYGGIGFFAGSQSEGNVTIGFDNLKVWEIK